MLPAVGCNRRRLKPYGLRKREKNRHFLYLYIDIMCTFEVKYNRYDTATIYREVS